MSERLFLGQTQGRQLLRITPPGVNASNLASKSSFSSDGDYLRVHAVIDAQLNRNNNYHWGDYSFPALGYLPMAFLSITHTDLNRVFYPNDRNPATTEMNNFWDWQLQDGHVWIYTTAASTFGGNYRARVLIFKNRADGFISA